MMISDGFQKDNLEKYMFKSIQNVVLNLSYRQRAWLIQFTSWLLMTIDQRRRLIFEHTPLGEYWVDWGDRWLIGPTSARQMRLLIWQTTDDEMAELDSALASAIRDVVMLGLDIWGLQPRLFLADRTAARSMIGYWHDTVVCLSVRPSATLCIMTLRVCVGRWKLYRRVFLGRHFLIISSDTIAVGCIMFRVATKSSHRLN